MKLAVCCWNLATGTEQTEELKRQTAADAVFASLQACTDQIAEWTHRAAARGEALQVVSETEPAQVAPLHRAGLAAVQRQELDQASRKIAEAFEVPIALVSLPDTGSPEANDTHENSLDAHVIAANDVLVSEDVTEDPRFADDPRVLEKGIRFYAGAPLRTSSGEVMGCLSLVDMQPRNFPDQERQRLQEMAGELMADIEKRLSSSLLSRSGDAA